MIVRDIGDAWQVVLQTDHAVTAGQFAAAWGNERFETPRPRKSLVTATARHDDGWAIWERAPSLLAQNGGPPKPRNFLDVQILSHLAFYRAQIAAVTDDDAYAGLLISMHGVGIYNRRFGTDPVLRLTFEDDEQRAIDAFKDEQGAHQDKLIEDLSVPEDERWVNYKLLQIFDRLSLYFQMKDVVNGEAFQLSPAPVNYAGEETTLDIQPDGPWRIKMDPFPFAGTEASFTMLRRVLPKRDWSDVDEFRREFFANPPEETTLVISAA